MTLSFASLHLAPNAPWVWLLLLSLGFVVLALWAYRFAVPPLPALARRALPALRIVSLLVLAWLLAQPVLERALGGGGRSLVVLLDRSLSMELPSTPGAPATRAQDAERAVRTLSRSWRGRAAVRVVPFAGTASDTSLQRGATALGTALARLPHTPEGRDADGVVIVSDGVVNAGDDPVAAARALGIPVHALIVGRSGAGDRGVAEVEASTSARVGEATPVRVRVTSSEPRGTPISVRLLDGARELGRTSVPAPGSGAEAVAEFRVTPARPGLAVWTAVLDSLAGELTGRNNARQVAIEVVPGRLGVLIVSGGLNWDLAFVRRAWRGDSSLSLRTLVRERGGWRVMESGRVGSAPNAAELRGKAVVVIDALAPGELPRDFESALSTFVRQGNAVLILAGPLPGLTRWSSGGLGRELAFTLDAQAIARGGQPAPAPEARELLSWDDDAARGERAWRTAAPLANVAPIRPGPGDRVVIGSLGGGPPLVLARRIGGGQALLVNGTGVWRWALSGHDELSAERSRRLWRRLVRWLAEPVQGEPLRVRPERWLTASGEGVRLFASLQDRDFRPVAGAQVEGEVVDASGRTRRVSFTPGAAGSYVAGLEGLAPGRYRVRARAQRSRRELGRAESELAIDRWSLEEARAEPDSATLAAIAAAGNGRIGDAADADRWAQRLEGRALARERTESLRLWESPWLFAVVVGALSLEWAWRRRRGLP
ncbi:MAG TPA: hypothetical protein VEY91_10625 [Candidatus Limnocylindria bacterium]|nr:hypothetical protein [Candidatus Limnocylindria bacterium]